LLYIKIIANYLDVTTMHCRRTAEFFNATVGGTYTNQYTFKAQYPLTTVTE